MIDFEKELESILQSDPLNLLSVKPKASSVINADERLLASFAEINTFVREHGHEPKQSRDIKERQLFSRLKGLREDIDKTAALLAVDELGLLKDVIIPVSKEIKTIDDVLGDDALGLLGDSLSATDNSEDIFTLKNVPKTLDMPEEVARRKPCKNFDAFEPRFKQCHADLVSGQSELKKFTGEQQISAGHFFILHGVMVYVAEVGDKEKKRGKVNARLKCIFENGTESNMLLRSLATELYKDESGRRILDIAKDYDPELEKITSEDVITGYIYILRSLSDDPKIKEINDLYKIGYSTQPVEQRLQNAAQEPTFLMANVRLLSEFKTYNLKPQKLELLLHIFFAKSCLNIDVFDNKGKRYRPREWFIVPLNVIESAVELLINGQIVNYQFDSQEQKIIKR